MTHGTIFQSAYGDGRHIYCCYSGSCVI